MNIPMQATLLIHIVGGAVGILSGYLAVAASKGAPLHRKAGIVFVCSMVAMSLTGAALATTLGQIGNLIGAVIAGYLVVTALTTVRPPSAASRRVDLAAMLIGFAAGLSATTVGVVTLARGRSTLDGAPIAMLLLFGGIALAASSADLRILRGAVLRGPRRIARHLWRMCFALFIATGSFFLGQADEIPAPLRITPLLAFLALLPIPLMLYWLWRVRVGRSALPAAVDTHDPALVVARGRRS